jgi:hypothetical protein
MNAILVQYAAATIGISQQSINKKFSYEVFLSAVMGTHSFIRYFVTVTVTVTSLVMAVTNEFLFSSACNEVTEAIGYLKNY